MTNIIQQNLGELLVVINNLLLSGIELTKENMPELLKQILKYAEVEARTYIIIGSVLLIVALVLILIDGMMLNFDALLIVPSILLMIAGFVLVIMGIMLAVKVSNAPMLYMIEKVTSLIKP